MRWGAEMARFVKQNIDYCFIDLHHFTVSWDVREKLWIAYYNSLNGAIYLKQAGGRRHAMATKG